MMKVWVIIAINPFGMGEVQRAEVEAFDVQQAINCGAFNATWIVSVRLKNLL